MHDEPKRIYNKGVPKDGHTKTQRHAKIKEILSDTTIQVTGLDNLVHELKKKGIETTEGTVSKDKKKLKFDLINENGITCYRMPTIVDEEAQNESIRDICEAACITRNSIMQKITTVIIKTNGYSHLLSDKLKKRFPKEIIDTLPLENSLVIFCDVGVHTLDDDKNYFVEELIEILRNKNTTH